VELLDHQKSLRQHHLPKSAMFVLKKVRVYVRFLPRQSRSNLHMAQTGIVDEHIGENDIFDNHFLFAMVRGLLVCVLSALARVLQACCTVLLGDACRVV
jgi:hypothetical protein